MKNKFLKILSALLVLSFLATTFSVFSFAEEDTGGSAVGENEDDIEGLELFVNRTYSEGWDYKNGFSRATPGVNKIAIDYEEDALGRYNYFTRFEVGGNGKSNATIDFGSLAVAPALREDTPGTVVEFSIKADDVASIGNILTMKTTVKSATIKLLDINEAGELVAFSELENGNYNLGTLGNEWINIAFIFDWLSDEKIKDNHSMK